MTGVAISCSILLISLLAGLPFYLSLLASGSFLIIVVNDIIPSMVVNGLYEGISKVSLVAVPFFLFAGSLMQYTTLSKKLVGAILPLVRGFRGGVPITAILTNEIFGAMSGSAPAAVGTIGRMMHPMVTKSNSEKLSLGLFASSGALSVIMPPSIILIVYGVVTNTSIGGLFLGGCIPSILIGVLVVIYLIAVSQPARSGEKMFNIAEIKQGLVKGLPALAMPVILLGGIYTGVFTPTEAGIVSAVYTLVIALFYRELSWKVFKACLEETVRLTSQIFILLAVSTVFSQALAISGVPPLISHTLSSFSPWTFLLGLNILLLIAGCFFDAGSAIVVLGPLLAPVGVKLGIDPLHIGIVFSVNLAIGTFTPPFGLNLFVIQSIFKRPIEYVARCVLPFIVIYYIAMILITYIPVLSLWLPKSAGF